MSDIYTEIAKLIRKRKDIWDTYNHSADWDFLPINMWPTDLIRAVLKKDLGYVERFRLFVYFVGNGMPAHKARDEVKRMVKGYDKKKHLDYLYRDLMSGKGLKWQYWDETAREIQALGDNEAWHSLAPGKRQARDLAYDPRPPRWGQPKGREWDKPRDDWLDQLSSDDDIWVYGDEDNEPYDL